MALDEPTEAELLANASIPPEVAERMLAAPQSAEVIRQRRDRAADGPPFIGVLDHIDNDRPYPPIHLSAEAAYGWECGWSAAVTAMRVELMEADRG